MDLFRFEPLADPKTLVLSGGSPITGYTSAMWVERYRDAGEFRIFAPLSSGLSDFLPPGSLISHVDTLDVMIVEDQQVRAERGEDPTIEITGRSFPTWLDNRIAGLSGPVDWGLVNYRGDYVLAAGYIAAQVRTMILSHMQPASVWDTTDQLANLSIVNLAPNSGTSSARSVSYGGVYTRAVELLALEDFGLRMARPGFAILGIGPYSNPAILIHDGTDRTDVVTFSWRS